MGPINKLLMCVHAVFRLLPCITEHLTAQIVQLTVSDITKAIEWMKCSYLYVRMKKARSSAHSKDRLLVPIFLVPNWMIDTL